VQEVEGRRGVVVEDEERVAAVVPVCARSHTAMVRTGRGRLLMTVVVSAISISLVLAPT